MSGRAVFALLILVLILALALVVVLMSNPSTTPDKLFKAWNNPVDHSLNSTTINTMYALRGDFVLTVLFAIPLCVGGLAFSMILGRKK